jgi:hypothetical protein
LNIDDCPMQFEGDILAFDGQVAYLSFLRSVASSMEEGLLVDKSAKVLECCVGKLRGNVALPLDRVRRFSCIKRQD